MFLAVAVQSHHSKAQDCYRLKLVDTNFTLEAVEQSLVPEMKRVVQIASSHNTFGLAFMDISGNRYRDTLNDK